MRIHGMALVVLVMASTLSAEGWRASRATVEIRTFRFRPDTLVVPAGAAVVWTNADEIEHTVTSDSAAHMRLTMNGTLRTRGATYEARFVAPGDYPYFCQRHAFMRGVVHVTTTGESR